MGSNGVVRRQRARERAIIRARNERIAGARPSGMFVEFLCECGCGESIPLGVNEYEAVRRRPDHFAVSPGHDRPMRERVVEACSRYAVVAACDLLGVAPAHAAGFVTGTAGLRAAGFGTAIGVSRDGVPAESADAVVFDLAGLLDPALRD